MAFPITDGSSSPEHWRDLLRVELMQRRARVDKLERYYRGKHPLPEPPKRLKHSALEEARKAYETLMALGVTNWVKLVADAPSERLEVTGFRFGEETAAADAEAWKIWQSNHLDADSGLVHDNALITGQSFVLVDPFDTEMPAITPEDSSQMIVAYRPGSRRDIAAALKWWQDEDVNLEMFTLYLPGSIHKWQHPVGHPTEMVIREVEGEMHPLPNPLGEVPVVEFAANQTLRRPVYGGGYGEFESVLAIQDRINKTTFDRLVTAEFQAFRQRWVVGWQPDTDPKTGLPRQDQVFKASTAFVMAFGGDPSEVQVGEFAQADFKQFLNAVESDVNAMAAISKTPPHYLLGAMVNISGDALTAAESGLTAKTKKHARNFGESWEQVMRLALRVQGSPLADDMQSQVLWGDIEHRTWGEQVDAVMKMGAEPISVPQEALWERLPDVHPQDIARWRAMNAQQALLQPEQPQTDDEDGADGTPAE